MTSRSPKDVTTVIKGAKEVTVFEGFMDFLSFMVIHRNKTKVSTNFLDLNSVSLFEKARPFIEQDEAIHLYLDNDATGQNFRPYALSLSSKYQDESNLYHHHKDLNDWLMDSGNKQKKRLRFRLGYFLAACCCLDALLTLVYYG